MLSQQSPETTIRPGFRHKVETHLIGLGDTVRIADLCARFPSEVSHIIESNRYQFIPEVRDVRVQWIPNVLFTKWMYDFIAELLTVGSERIGTLSYLTYNVGDHYTWHADVGEVNEDVAWRKWAGSIQLSPPDDYDGGELQLRADPYDYIADKAQGSVLMFNPEICHRVTPITRGMRRSLVFWVCDEGEEAPQRG